MLKKMLSLLLALVFCFALLAGCGGNTDDTTAAPTDGTNAPTETTEATEPAYETPDLSGVKITQYSVANGDYDPEGTYVNKAVEKKLGLDLEIIELDSYSQQVASMIAEKKPPELLFINNYSHATWASHGEDGAFINFMEYLDQMPNVKAFLERPELAISVEKYTYDGKMYALPVTSNADVSASVYTFIYREDIFKANNLKWPTNQEEFVQVLRELKKIYPNSEPFVLRSLTKNMQTAQAMGHLFGGSHVLKGNFGTYFTLDENGEYYLAQISTAYKEMAQFMHDLTAEDLLHGSSMTLDTAGWTEAFSSEKSFIGFDKIDRIPVLNQAGVALNPNFNLVAGEPFNMGTYAKESEVVTTTFPSAGAVYGWMVGATSGDKLDDILAYVDWLYSEEGTATTSWGVEDESYVVNADGTKSFKEGFLDANGGLNGTGLYKVNQSGYLDFDAYLETCTPDIAEAMDMMRDLSGKAPRQYILAYNEDEQFIWDSYAETMYNHINGEWCKFVLGQRDFSEWDSLLQDLKDNYYYDEILKIHESALARLLEEQA